MFASLSKFGLNFHCTFNSSRVHSEERSIKGICSG